ncbi:MAG TPA: hypothetical protein VFX65_15125 [Candidatus Limnocylindrales bacterium]|nr:hypothetical protein [Candidatus Limnocylindrales bacterium]
MTDAAALPVDGPTAPSAEAVAPAPGPQRALTGSDASGRPWPPFAHGSEAEMARILDFYEVDWEYEPRTFPILWNLDGEVVESFSPDFYLPQLDLFLELTTLKQRLVRKKNRKLRRLRELYPDIRIKLFYARDFRAMMLKYGRLALADSLSGTLGQVMPERAEEALEAVPAPPADRATPTDRGRDDEPAAAPAAAVAEAEAVAEAGAAGPVAVELEAIAAPSGPPVVGSSSRRNASRSRRRRAAAAARAAARSAEPSPIPTASGRHDDGRARR